MFYANGLGSQGVYQPHHELLASIAAKEASGEWRSDGGANFACWVASTLQESYPEARRWVEDARALRDRPALDAAYQAGEVSCAQMRALNVLATTEPDHDAVWLELIHTGGEWDISALEREARKTKARELEKLDEGRYLSMQPSPDERYMRGRFQLPFDEGAIVMKALDRAVPHGTPWQGVSRFWAHGLVELARASLSSDQDPDRANVVLVLDPETGVASIDTVGFVPMETADRLSCDARIQTVACAHCGASSTTRVVSPAMFREVKERDKTCVHPDCNAVRFTEAHHIIPRRHHGPTELWNLVLLCGSHHRLVHEGGWRLEGQAGPELAWIRPDGTKLIRRARALCDTS